MKTLQLVIAVGIVSSLLFKVWTRDIGLGYQVFLTVWSIGALLFVFARWR